MADLQSRRFLVSGRVQGVFFRESTRRKATELGITGSAVNLLDGRVQVLAWGEASAIGKLEAWLWKGPKWAQVSDLEVSPYPGEAPAGFTTG